jgi:hypothetical protein
MGNSGSYCRRMMYLSYFVYLTLNLPCYIWLSNYAYYSLRFSLLSNRAFDNPLFPIRVKYIFGIAVLKEPYSVDLT